MKFSTTVTTGLAFAVIAFMTESANAQAGLKYWCQTDNLGCEEMRSSKPTYDCGAKHIPGGDYYNDVWEVDKPPAGTFDRLHSCCESKSEGGNKGLRACMCSRGVDDGDIPYCGSR